MTTLTHLPPGLAERLAEILAGILPAQSEELKAFRAHFAHTATRFDPHQHPRDYRGKFVDTPDVTLPDGTRGVAVGTDPHGKVTVATAVGETVQVAPEKLTETAPAPSAAPAAPKQIRKLIDAAKATIGGSGRDLTDEEVDQDTYVQRMLAQEWQYGNAKKQIAENERLIASHRHELDLGYDESRIDDLMRVGVTREQAQKFARWSDEAVRSFLEEIGSLEGRNANLRQMTADLEGEWAQKFADRVVSQGRQDFGTILEMRPMRADDNGPAEHVDAALAAVLKAGKAIDDEVKARFVEREVARPTENVAEFDKAFDDAANTLSKVQRADQERQYREKFGVDYATVDHAIRHTLRRAEDRGDVAKADEMYDRLAKHQEAFWAIEPDATRPEIVAARAAYEAQMEKARAEYQRNIDAPRHGKKTLAEIRLEVLAEIRPMGGTPPPMKVVAPAEVESAKERRPGAWGGRDVVDVIPDDLQEAMVAAMDEAATVYPAEWNTAAATHEDRPKTLTFTRRGYNSAEGDIALSLDGAPWEGAAIMRAVAVHEYGHTMERVVDGLTALEWAFHWKRTTRKRAGRREHAMTGPNAVRHIYGGRNDEIGIQDKFRSHYSGKIYGDSPAVPWELFTTAAESLFAGSPYLDDDPEFASFALGILAVL